MALDAIQHQLQFLREDTRGRARAGAIGGDLGDRWGATVSHACSTALGGARRGMPLADGLWDRIELDLAYILTRHAFWLEAPVFNDVIADRLARGYRLERTVAETIAHDATGSVLSKRPPFAAHINPTDTEFLRFILVSCAIARDDDGLTQDLGLGRGFLTHIQKVLAGSLATPTPATRYLPEIDHVLTRIMMSLASELKLNPWAMEASRLSYQMTGVAEPWLSWIASNGGSQLFSLLLRIGDAGDTGISLRTMIASNQQFPGAWEDLAQILVERGLLDPVNHLHRTTNKMLRPRFRLSPFARNLTAEAFATQNMTRTTIATIQKLNASYQAAVIRRLPDSQIDFLRTLAHEGSPALSPAATSALLDRLETILDQREWQAFALARAERSPSLLIRQAAVRALVQRGDSDSLVRISNQDQSPWVREVAWNGLLRLKEGGDR